MILKEKQIKVKNKLPLLYQIKVWWKKLEKFYGEILKTDQFLRIFVVVFYYYSNN